jgi:hypothetical protein
VSRWFRKHLKVYLSPSRIIIWQTGHFFSSNIYAVKEYPVENRAYGKSAWAPVVKLLDKLLEDFEGPLALSFIISNQFARYQLVEPNINLNSAQEEEQYIRFNLGQIYGDVVSQWEVSWGPQLSVRPQLVSAIDRSLLDALRSVTSSHKSRIKSVEPYLMSAFNLLIKLDKRKLLRFVLVDGESACSATVREGVWLEFRASRLQGALEGVLEGLVEREFLTSELATREDELLFCVPKKMTIHFLPAGPIKLMTIHPAAVLVGSHNISLSRKLLS